MFSHSQKKKTTPAKVVPKWNWSDFLTRCRSRSLSLEDLPPLSKRVLVPWFIFCGLGLAPFVIYTEEGLLNLAAKLTLFTTVPIWVTFFGIISYCAPPKKAMDVVSPMFAGLFGISVRNPITIQPVPWMIAWPAAIGVIYAYMTIGLFVWINALGSSQEIVIIAGPVVEKHRGATSKYGTGSYLVVKSRDRNVQLQVSKENYEKFAVGHTYTVKMRRGLLGYLFRWPHYLL